MRRIVLAAALALAAVVVSDRSAAQVAGFPPPPPKTSPAAGAIDLHVHSEPDVFGRSMDDIDVAVLAKRKGLRGIVLKNHVTNTADRAVLVMKIVPDLEVFGGVVLNRSVGGLNPAAVEAMYRMSGGRGKVVWLPTFDSDKHVKTLVSKDQSGIVVAPNGVVVPPLEEILKIIARENLVLATGHVHAEEVVAVVKRARELGVKNIIVTHGLTNIPGLTMAQAKQVAQMGAYIEICHLQTMTGPNAQYDWMRHWTQVSVKDVATAVKEIGADHLVLSTDLGQRGMMTHPDGIEQMIQQVKAQGVSQEDLDKMTKTNPARLLGLGT
jgi:Family of unknown function (DUF6282)